MTYRSAHERLSRPVGAVLRGRPLSRGARSQSYTQVYTHNSTRKKDALAALAVVLTTAAIFALLFNRESTLSYSIGYNLYGAERILAGEVPYRDFHTLYPPATVYVNAALFRFLGITLYTALLGVLAFKVLTTLFIYLCGVHLMPRAWALLAALSSIIWLRPNGPFKAVPMHYGALFLALALYFALQHQRSRRWGHLFVAGAMLGALALFKHNIAAYALLGFLPVAVINARRTNRRYRGPLLVLAGMALPVVPVLLYMQLQGALVPMLETLLFGPGDFLLSRLAAAPGARIPALCLVLLGAVVLVAYKLRPKPGAASAILSGMLILLAAFCLRAGQSAIDEIVFYAPVFVLAAGGLVFAFSIRARHADLVVLLVLTAAAAAFLESFPRFAREQAIAAMPFVTLLMLFLLHRARDTVRSFMSGAVPRRMAAAILPVAFFLIGARILFNTYFDRSFHFKSDTRLNIERGGGVYFPNSTAREIDDVVAYIQEKVPPGGYFFAQSYAGSSFLFLADRRNPSGAQFWGGVGVSEAERAATLKSLGEKQVNLVVTSDRDVAAERYEPMREYVDRNFRVSKVAGDVVILERI
jgi:hypothetical protein